MLLLALLPYIIILSGMFLGYMRIGPAMLAWAICMLGALSGIAIAIIALRQGQFWVLAAIAIVPFLVTAILTIRDLTYPLINDVTTDVDHPPVFSAALQAPAHKGPNMEFPARFAPVVKKSYPELQPLFLDSPASEIFQRAFALIDERVDWKVTHSDDATGVIEAKVTTAVLRFVDDVVVRVRREGGRTRVDMRSKSREGLVDGGLNAKRIQDFLGRLEGRRLVWGADTADGPDAALKKHRPATE